MSTVKQPNRILKQFESDGFLTMQDLLSVPIVHELIPIVNNYLHELVSYDSRDRLPMFQFVNLWKTNAVVKELVFHKAITNIVKQILKSESILLWHDQLLVKPPNGRESGWHQDFPFWPMHLPLAVTCWIPLTNVNESNGCLRFFKGSHKWRNNPSLLPLGDKDMMTMHALHCNLKHSCSVAAHMKIGDVSFHHGLVFHGAYANATNSSRIAIKIIYMSPRTRFKELSHHLTYLSNLKENDLLSEESFLTIK